RSQAVRNFGETAVDHPVEDVKAGLFDLASHVGAQFAVHRFERLSSIRESEWDALERRSVHVLAEHDTAEVKELNGAGAQLGEGTGAAAELAGRKQLEL